MIQKLTTLQGQIASTSGNKAAQKRIAGASNDSFFTQLTDKTQAVREDAAKVVANSNITVNVDQDINKQFEKMAQDISNATGRDIKEVKRQIEQIQKKNLEEAKAKKEKK